MLDSLYIGATGMQAQQQNIDTIANNLANVNTTGFKRSRIDFEDLLYRNVSAGATQANAASASNRIGMGTAIASVGKVFTGGDVKKTGEPLDLAINGAGFFEILMPDGTLAYTRNGALQMNSDGMLVTRDGQRLNAPIQVPADATSVQIDANGKAFASVPGEKRLVELGQIEISTFPNPAGLTALGDNLFVATEQSGQVNVGHAGENGAGTLGQGFLEGSNVRLIDEMIGLIVAQRAYEINAKVVQASDELLTISNGLYR
jgi:flagellar basal-body rod protein FlgG